MGKEIMTAMETVKTEAAALITTWGLKVLIALLILLIGWFIVKRLVKLTAKAFEKSKMEVSLRKFLVSAISIALKVLLFIIVIQQLGIQAISIVTVIGAAGLGIAMALQGSLANLVGGLLILLLRPFSVGGYIQEAAFGNEGTVDEIHVFYSPLITINHKTFIIPNGPLANSSNTNYTKQRIRRIDLEFGVDYTSDTDAVKAAIMEVINELEQVIDKENTVIKINRHADSAVVFLVMAWCEAKNYLSAKLDIIEKVKLKFDERGISIPYPHMDVKIRS